MTENRRKWFQEARFGMFLHWGLYSITGRDMWYYSTELVDKDQYEKLFSRFNPVDYDPVEWARLAKAAGMKYAVLTTKHHDGFCLFDSQFTDFKVTNTLYKKDLVRLWLDAFRNEGLKVGLYYSLIDWHHPHYTVDYLHPQRARMAELNQDRDFSIYQQYLHDQVCELMSNYGKIDLFWPDFSYGADPRTGTPGKTGQDWKALELRDKIFELQPQILFNNRMDVQSHDSAGSNQTEDELMGDFATPEQYIPTSDIAGGQKRQYMWEACETMGSSWGYYRGDDSIKSASEIIRHLVTCVSNNGNLLLNVGPTPRGRIQPEFIERLRAVGQWLDINAESIYVAGSAQYSLAKGCPELHPLFTQKSNQLYMHFLQGSYPPYDLILNGLGGKVDAIEFVSDQTMIEFDEVEWDGMKHIKMHMPIIRPDPYDTVVRIILKA